MEIKHAMSQRALGAGVRREFYNIYIFGRRKLVIEHFAHFHPQGRVKFDTAL